MARVQVFDKDGKALSGSSGSVMVEWDIVTANAAAVIQANRVGEPVGFRLRPEDDAWGEWLYSDGSTMLDAVPKFVQVPNAPANDGLGIMEAAYPRITVGLLAAFGLAWYLLGKKGRRKHRW